MIFVAYHSWLVFSGVGLRRFWSGVNWPNKGRIFTRLTTWLTGYFCQFAIGKIESVSPVFSAGFLSGNFFQSADNRLNGNFRTRTERDLGLVINRIFPNKIFGSFHGFLETMIDFWVRVPSDSTLVRVICTQAALLLRVSWYVGNGAKSCWLLMAQLSTDWVGMGFV